MCMSVPQMAERWILMRTSLCPTVGSGMSCIQIPGSARALTSAFMFLWTALVNDAEITPGATEDLNDTIELHRGVRRVHLRSNSRLPVRNDRKGKRHDIDSVGLAQFGQAHCQRSLAQHDGNDGMFSRKQIEAQGLHLSTEIA